VSRLSLGDTLDSDGVTESPNSAGEEFGDERLLDSQRHHRTLDACAVAKGIVVDVSQFSAGDHFDDITLIVAKRIGKA
jgi:serine phosphatase RsbU (regulator of sigma subunit)